MRKLFIVPLAGLLGACSILPSPKAQPITQYELAPPAASGATGAITAAQPACPLVLRVRDVEVNPPYATDGLLYTESPHALSSYAWHRWAATPGTMLTADVTAAVAASGLYRAVLGPTDPGDADLTLAVRLDRGPLQVFAQATRGGAAGTPGASTEEIAITATLANSSTGAVVGTRAFSGSRSADPTPYGGVAAASQLTGSLLGDMLSWLRGLGASACAGK